MPKHETYYCPYCGKTIMGFEYEEFPNSNDFKFCHGCGSEPNFQPLKHDDLWYNEKAEEEYKEKYGEDDNSSFMEKVQMKWRIEDLIRDKEIESNPLFNPEKKEIRIKKENELRTELYYEEKAKREKRANENSPKCPTCGSTNISKLTATNRLVHGAAFGLFSKTARSQWKCKSCGNLW